MDELDGDPLGDGRRRALRRGEEGERRPQALPSRRERVGADRRDRPGIAGDDGREPLLDGVEVGAAGRVRP